MGAPGSAPIGAVPVRVLFNMISVPENETGMGVYAHELLAALVRRRDAVLTPIGSRLAPRFASAERLPFRGVARIAWEQLRLGPLRRDDVHLVHGPLFAVPVLSRVPTVSTLHDLAFVREPSLHTWRSRAYHRMLVDSARTADRVIAPSAFVADDIVKYLSYSRERVRVVYEAPRTSMRPAGATAVQALRERLGEERPYLLSLGTLAPHKRTEDAVQALANLRGRGHDVALLVAGTPHLMEGPLHAEVRRLGLDSAVKFLGYVPDTELAALYTGATALVFPSLIEGFGLPPLEAMACGTPVITTDLPAMSEVLAGAAIFVPPRDPVAIAAAAARLLASTSEREEWAGRGLEHAARFSWERAAEETVAVYREAAGM